MLVYLRNNDWNCGTEVIWRQQKLSYKKEVVSANQHRARNVWKVQAPPGKIFDVDFFTVNINSAESLPPLKIPIRIQSIYAIVRKSKSWWQSYSNTVRNLAKEWSHRPVSTQGTKYIIPWTINRVTVVDVYPGYTRLIPWGHSIVGES